MYEFACEPQNSCNNDQYSFKAYLARWMSQAAIVAPYIADAVWPLLARSATAAAESCTGGATGEVCGTRWYTGGYDGISGVGQSLSALETVQSLLLLRGDVEGIRRYPATAPSVAIEVVEPTGTFTISPTGTRMPGTGNGHRDSQGPEDSSGRQSPDANAGNRLRVDSASGAGFWFRLVLPVAAAMAFGGWLVWWHA